MAKNYRTVIMCDVENDGNIQYFEADIEQPVNEDLGIDVTMHPTVNGDLVADHMVIQPTNMTITGTFSLVGNKPTAYNGASGRLANIQDTFEKIMKNGLFCSVATLSKVDNSYENAGNVRFLQRDNMVLRNIHWTKGNGTLGFTFNFVEVLVVDADENLYNGEADDLLPILTSVNELNFADEYLDINKLYDMLVKMMWDCDLITLEFLEGFVTSAQTNTQILSYAYLAAGIAGLVACGAIVSGVISGALSVSTLFPVGTIIAGVALISLALAAGFAALAKWFNQQKYTVKAFKHFKDDVKNQAEYTRFSDFTSEVVQQIIQLNDYCKVYGIASNVAQDCALVIDNTYYIFRFEKNNVTGKWSLNVYNYREELVCSQGQLSYLTNIGQCTTSNRLFTTPSGQYVYLMNSAVEEYTVNKPYYYLSELAEIEDDLTNYKIFITPFDMTEFNNMLLDIMKNALGA